MAIGRRHPGAVPRVLGRDPRDYERDLQDFLDKLGDSEAGGLPPTHGATHAFTGADPLTAPTETPTTVSGASVASAGDGAAPAREDHVHPLDISGTPGTVAAASAQGAGPGASLSGHTHRLAIPAQLGGLIGSDGVDPIELAPGPDNFVPLYFGGATGGLTACALGTLVDIATAVNYAVSPGDGFILVDATAGAVAVTLPAASAGYVEGATITIKKKDASANAVTVAPAGVETIDGAASYSLPTQYKAVTLISDGANWYIIGKV